MEAPVFMNVFSSVQTLAHHDVFHWFSYVPR